MKENRSPESLAIAEATGHSLHPLDLRVQALGTRVGHAEDIGVEDADQLVPNRLRHLDHRLDAAALRPVQPSVPGLSCPGACLVAPDVPSGFLQGPSTRSFEGAVLQGTEALELLACQGFRFLEPDVLGALEALVTVLHELAILLPTHLVDSIAEVLHDVESIEGDLPLRIGYMPCGREDVGLPHVHAHGLEAIEPFLAQALVEGVQCDFPSTIGNPDHVPGLEVVDHGDVLVPLLKRGLVHADSLRLESGSAKQATPDRALLDSVDLIPSQVELLGDGRDTGLFEPGDNHGFEESREGRIGLSPRHGNLLDPVLFAADSGDLDLDHGSVLAGRKVSPAPLAVVVPRAACAARGARQSGLGRLDSDHNVSNFQLWVDAGHTPGLGHAEDGAVKGRIEHAMHDSGSQLGLLHWPLPTRDAEAPKSVWAERFCVIKNLLPSLNRHGSRCILTTHLINHLSARTRSENGVF